MSFCSNCGFEFKEEVKFCPSCGKEIGKKSNDEKKPDFVVENQTGDFFKDDISQNTVFAVLAYIGPLFLVPLLAAPKSQFARFHANQGLVLFICECALWIIRAIVLIMIRIIFPLNIIRGAIVAVFSIVWLLLFAMSIVGIVYAVQGHAKELPLFGKIKILQ